MFGNNVELFVTFEPEKYVKVKNILECHQIPYTIRTKNNTDSYRHNIVGHFGENVAASIQYQILVKKDKLEEATYFLNKELWND